MTIPFMDITCVSQRNYGHSKQSSTYRLPALKGRPRYRLRDSHATYIVSVEWEFTPEQYAEWHRFWYNDIAAGALGFEMRLMMDSAVYYSYGGEIYQVHAFAPFDSTYQSWGSWIVRLQLEVAGGFREGLNNCPTIYGGPIRMLAEDDYYGGPISDLATDIIAPCEGVLGGDAGA